ncbi:MAG: hypothetical protein WCA89_08760 [Terracidiphilus sp.]|jgi:bifunctional DNA-binding transcriptional regulator/antitoxin component of YhaV-PrlF toxin-antitoxin module
MATLTVTARGQVTFRKDVLNHLGVKPGEKIALELMPGGRAALRAVEQKAPVRLLHGFLKGKTNGAVLSAEEIEDAIAKAGAAAGAGK